jgi:hypothetical protein
VLEMRLATAAVIPSRYQVGAELLIKGMPLRKWKSLAERLGVSVEDAIAADGMVLARQLRLKLDGEIQRSRAARPLPSRARGLRDGIG